MQLNLAPNQLYLPDYEAEKGKWPKFRILTLHVLCAARITEFITNFEDVTIKEANKDPLHGKKKYMAHLVSQPLLYYTFRA